MATVYSVSSLHSLVCSFFYYHSFIKTSTMLRDSWNHDSYFVHANFFSVCCNSSTENFHLKSKCPAEQQKINEVLVVVQFLIGYQTGVALMCVYCAINTKKNIKYSSFLFQLSNQADTWGSLLCCLSLSVCFPVYHCHSR